MNRKLVGPIGRQVDEQVISKTGVAMRGKIERERKVIWISEEERSGKIDA